MRTWLEIGVGAAAAGAALWFMTGPRFRRLAWPEALLAFSVLAGLAAPLCRATWTTWQQMTATGAAPFRWLALAGCGALAAGLLAWHRLRAPSTRVFLIGVLGIGLAARLAYVLLIDVKPISDFEMMWSLANELATQGLGPKGFCFARERSLGFFLPLIALFGAKASVYETANVFATVATSVMTYVVARRWFGEGAGRAALVITMLAPETYFASGIPTHDVPGAMYLMLSLLLLDQLWLTVEQGAWRRAAALSFATGVVVEMTDLQRGFGAFWRVAVLTSVALIVFRRLTNAPESERKSGWRPLALLATLVFAVPHVVATGMWRATQATGLAGTDEEHSTWMSDFLLVQTQTYSAGSFTDWAANSHFPYVNVDIEQKRELVLDSMRSDLVLNDELRRIPNHFTRTYGMLLLGSQDYFYYGPALSNPGSVLSQPEAAARLTWGNIAFVALFQPLLAFALALLALTLTFPPRSWPALLFLLAWIFGMTQFGEVQPRYSYPIWFIGPIFMGGALTCLRRRTEPTLWLRNAGQLLVAGAAICAVTCVTVTAASVVLSRSDRVFLDLTQWQPRTDEQGGDRRVRARADLPEHAPAGTRVVLSHADQPIGPKLLRLWLRLDIPYGQQRDGHDALESTVTVNGAEVARVPLSDTVHLVEVPVTPDAAGLNIEVAAIAKRDLTDTDARRFIIEYVQLLEPGT